MKKLYQIMVRRTSYEMLKVYAENEEEAALLACKNQGFRDFKADDTIQLLAIKEADKEVQP